MSVGDLRALLEVMQIGMLGGVLLPRTPVMLLLICGEMMAKYGARALNRMEVWWDRGDFARG